MSNFLKHPVHCKANLFCSVIFVMFGVRGKILKNHDSGRTVLHPLPLKNPLVWHVYGYDPQAMSLIARLAKWT